jgi:hypothetical protein
VDTDTFKTVTEVKFMVGMMHSMRRLSITRPGKGTSPEARLILLTSGEPNTQSALELVPPSPNPFPVTVTRDPPDVGPKKGSTLSTLK